jgi:hypothetical protein
MRDEVRTLVEADEVLATALGDLNTYKRRAKDAGLEESDMILTGGLADTFVTLKKLKNAVGQTLSNLDEVALCQCRKPMQWVEGGGTDAGHWTHMELEWDQDHAPTVE